MNLIIRKPRKDEEHIFVELSCNLLKYNRENDPQKHVLQIALDARRKRAVRLFREMNDKKLILLAFLNEEPVGFVRTHLYEPDKATDVVDELVGNVDELFVQKHVRGKGIGHMLLKNVDEWMKQFGVKTVTLQVFAWNRKASLFYEKEGYKVVDICLRKQIV